MMLAIDYETSKKPHHMAWDAEAFPVCVALAGQDGFRKVLWYTHREGIPNNPREELEQVLSRYKTIVGHNLKFDYEWGCTMDLGDILLNKPLWCTSIVEYLLNAQFGDTGRRSGQLSLNGLCDRYKLGRKEDLVAKYWESGYETDEIPQRILESYVQHDADLALKIALIQRNLIPMYNLSKLMMLCNEEIKLAGAIELSGMTLDKTLLRSKQIIIGRQIDTIAYNLRKEWSLPAFFNFNSHEHISALLFGGTVKYNGVELVRKTLKSGKVKEYTRNCKSDYIFNPFFQPKKGWLPDSKGFYTVDKTILAELNPKSKALKKLIADLLALSNLRKQKQTYYDGLLERMDTNGSIHPSINLTSTKTGRPSASNPNSQNIPRAGTSEIKTGFVTGWDDVYEF